MAYAPTLSHFLASSRPYFNHNGRLAALNVCMTAVNGDMAAENDDMEEVFQLTEYPNNC